MTQDSTTGPTVLIEPGELVEHLGTGADPVLLDVRWEVGEPSRHGHYLAGHLPGARWCDLDGELADPPGARGRHPLPDPALLQDAFRRWGIDEDSDVVVYDGGTGVAAARAWWVLRWAGHSRVRVLRGGLRAWLSAGLPVTAELPGPAAGQAVVRPGSLPTISADTAATWAQAGHLIDVRAAERYRGEHEPIDPRAGHIPGARNLPTTGNLDASGCLLPPAELRARFAAAGVTGVDAVGVYCGSGVTAAHTALALAAAGIESVLYPGSWSEWINDPSRPIAVGPHDQSARSEEQSVQSDEQSAD